MMKRDPRKEIIEKRFAALKRILVFASGKGGVGKTSCASVAALLLAHRGINTGLLDLDFSGASGHIMLGIEPGLPEEAEGILPVPVIDGLRFFGSVLFTGNRALPLRGAAATDAILEMFAVVRWEGTEVLCIDTPPGAGDELMDICKLLPRGEIMLVTTPSVLSLQVTARIEGLFRRIDARYAGSIVNMTGAFYGKDRAAGPASYLGAVPFYPDFELEIGDPAMLRQGRFGKAMDKVLSRLRF